MTSLRFTENMFLSHAYGHTLYNMLRNVFRNTVFVTCYDVHNTLYVTCYVACYIVYDRLKYQALQCMQFHTIHMCSRNIGS